MVVAMNSYSYEATEIHTQVAVEKEIAEYKFYKLCKAYLDEEKDRCIENYSVNNELSYSELREIATEEGDIIDYGYENHSNNQIFSIRKEYNDGIEYINEEYVIKMYFCDFKKGDNSQFFSLNDNSEDVDDFFIQLSKIKGL